MGKDKDKTSKSGKQRPSSMAIGEDLTKHPWPEVEAIQRDRERSRESPRSKSTKSSFSETNSTHKEEATGITVTKSKSTKKKGGLFSKFRKSTNDLSEWNKNDEKLSMAVDNDDVSKVVPLLSKKSVDATKLDPKGSTAFHRAAEQGKFAIVEAMLAYKADTNAQDVQGRTPLHCAVRYGRTQVAERLMQENNNNANTDLNKQTALHHATRGGSADCVRLLIQYHAPLDLPDKDGWSALFYAAKMGYQSICRELVEAGSNVNAGDNNGRSPITFAAEYGQVQVCEFLVKKGANIHLQDFDGRDGKDWAAIGGYQEIKTLFDRAPAQANWTTDPSETYENTAIEEDSDTKVQAISITADETDVTPYEEELKFDKLDLGIEPLLDKEGILNSADYSSAQVNCDEEYDDIDDAIVPMEEMEAIDKQFASGIVNGDHVETHVYENFQTTAVPIVETSVTVNHTSSVKTSNDMVNIDALKELEEENDVLSAELNRISLENKHLKEKIEKQDLKHPQQVTIVNETHDFEMEESKQRISDLEDEINQLRDRLAEADKKHESLLNDISKRPPSVANVNDSWVDSGDDEDKSVNRGRDDQDKQIAVLKSQVLELSKQNEHLQSQMKLLDEVNHNEKNGDLQTTCDDLLAYKTRMQEDLSHLQNFLSSKKTTIATSEADSFLPDGDSTDKDLWMIRKDVEVICKQVENNSSQSKVMDETVHQELERIREENKTLKDALEDLDSVNHQLQQENLQFEENQRRLRQDEETQEAYRLQIQEETVRLQQEKHELTLLMHEIQTASQQQQRKEEVVQQSIAANVQAEAKEVQNVGTQQDMPAPEGPLAALTMEGITLNVSEIVCDKADDNLESIPAKQNVERQLSEQKLMLESVLKQVKEEKSKLVAIESKLVDSKDTLKTMNLQIDDLNNAVENKEKEKSEIEDILDMHKNEVKEIEKAKDERNNEIAKLNSVLESKQSEIDSVVLLLKQKNEEREKMENSGKRLKELQEEISKNHEKVSKLNKDCEQKQKELKKLNSESKELVKEISQSKEEQEQLMKEKDVIILEKQSLLAERQHIRTQLKNDKLELESVDSNIAKLKSGDLESEETVQMEQIAAIKAVVENAVRSSPKSVDQEDDKRLQILFEQEKEIKELQEINQALADQIEELRQTSTPSNDTLIDKLKDENERLRDENEYLLENMNAPGSENGDVHLQNECEILKKENSRLYDDIKSLRTLIEKTSGEEAVSGELTYLRSQNDNLTTERQQLEVNNMELHNLMEALQQTLQEREQQERAELKRAVFEAMDQQPGAESDTDSEILDYKVEIDDLKALNADQQGEIHMLRREKQQVEAALAALQDASEGMMHTHNSGKEEYKIKLTTATEETKTVTEKLAIVTKENETLKETVEKLQKAGKSASKSTGGNMPEKYNNAQEELENIKEQLEHTQEENEQFLETIKELESQVVEQEKQEKVIKELNDDNDVLVTEIQDLQKEIKDLTSAKDKTADEKEKLSDQLKKAEKERKDLEEENKVLLREQLKRHIENDAEKQDTSKTEISKTESQTVKSSESASKDELHVLQGALKDLREKNEQLVINIDKVKEQLKTESDSRDSREKELSELSQELQEQREQNAELASQLEEFATKLESIGADHETEIQEEQVRSQQEIDRLVDVSKDLTTELDRYKDLIEDLKDDNEAKVQDLMEEQDFLLEKIKALETNQAAKEKTFKNEDINEKDEIIQDLETQVEEFKEKLDNAKKELETLQNENEEYKKNTTTEEEKSTAKEAETKLKQLQQENIQLTQQVETLKEELTAKKSKSPSPVPSPTPDHVNTEIKVQGGGEQIKELQKAVVALQHQLQESEKRHRDVVNTYRTHLLAAAEGRMDPEVKHALMHIIQLRSSEDSQSC